jgi:hypothetical protein
MAASPRWAESRLPKLRRGSSPPFPVIYKWTLEGTDNGPGGTGKRVRISGFEEWRAGEDGLVAESLGNFDAAEYQRQVEHGVDGK